MHGVSLSDTSVFSASSYKESRCPLIRCSINGSQFLGAPLYLINQDWYNAWIAFTKQSWGLLTMTMTQWWAPTIVRVSGDSTMRGQLLQTVDGSLLCDFPERMILIANHQIYTDWLYLWWIGYTAGMHGRIYVVLKESLKRIPVIGWGMQFAQFIFLKRKWEQDKPRMAAHLQKFNNPKDPMWLMMFPEGTNLADSTREASKQWAVKNGIKDMQHTLLPRSTGLHFILQELQTTVDYVYDCTIAYEGVKRGEFAQDIFTVGASYFGGRPPKSVNMYWRRFKVSQIPLKDPKKFEIWLRQRWTEKDKFIEDYLCTGRLPADKGTCKNGKGEKVTGAGYIEAEIKPKYWYEFLQVFAPIGLFALVLYMFYGALPAEVLNKIQSIDQKTVLKKISAYQRGQVKIPDQERLKAAAMKALQDQQRSGGSRLRNAALAHGVVTLNGVPQDNFSAKGLESPEMRKAAKLKPRPVKAKPIRKPPTKPKPVTLNGVPLKDFPAKGLEEAAKVSAVPTSAAQPNGASHAPKAPSEISRLVTLPNKIQTIKAIGKSPQSDLHTSQPASKAATKQPITSNAKTASTKLNANTTKISKGTTMNKPNTVIAPTSTEVKPAKRSSAPSVGPFSGSVESSNFESGEIRKARKKLELRQGKQEPRRKTRRALAVPGSIT